MINYFIIVSICWIALYLVYFLFLKRETFFLTNRAYLVSSLILGLLIPAYRWIPADWYVQTQDSTAFFISDAIQASVTVAPQSTWSWIDLVAMIYMAGILFMAARFAHGLLRIYRLYRSGIKDKSGSLNLVYTDQLHLPFSFWQTVFISNELPLSDELESILTHEEVHIKEWHTVDILLVEVFHIFFWFNPIIPLYKKAIRQAHEYVADAVVIKDISRKSYGQLLLRQSQSGLEIALANHFFHSQIKKRIIMMYQEKSKRPAMVKYLMAAPVLALLLVVFSSHTTTQEVAFSDECDNPSIAMIKHEKHGTITYKYCSDGNGKIDYAEIIESDPPIKNGAITKKLLREFIDAGVPPTPPPPPAPPVIIEAAPAPSAPSTHLKIGKELPLIVEEPTNTSNSKVDIRQMIPPPPPPPPAPPVPTNGEEIYKKVDEMPRFPGCEDITGGIEEKTRCAQQKFLEYIYSNLKYPKQARANNTQGTVVVQFKVLKDGSIGDAKVVRSVKDGCDKEALRVVNSMNTAGIKWIPGKQKGKNVSVLYTLPIRYKLSDNGLKANCGNENKIVLSKDKEKPLFVVDGKKLDRGSNYDIQPDEIEAISVLKGDAAVEKYGEEAEHGAVIITTKNKSGNSVTPRERQHPLTKLLKLNDFVISPNPTSESFRLQFTGEKGPIKIEVLDISGRLLHSQKFDDFSGTFDETISNEAFRNTQALVKISQGKNIYSTNIIFVK